MGVLEKLMMNSPVRAWILRHYEAPLLKRLGGSLEGMDVLEVGCGIGASTQLILEQFGAQRVVAIDLDSDLLVRARRRLAPYMPARVEIQLGDVTALKAADQSFDAVVDFAALHHVPNWQVAVSEIRRVLKPGGRFLFEDVTKRWLDKWFARTFFLHPVENRFTTAEFVAELEGQGIQVDGHYVERSHGDYVFGVGWRR
jgi:ubiquinone/menaquinone biosynthesis C-methylase UbiE